MLRPSSRRSNSNRPIKPGPFAWVRRLGVFRAISESSSHHKRRDRARERGRPTPSLLSNERRPQPEPARESSPESTHTGSENGQVSPQEPPLPDHPAGQSPDSHSSPQSQPLSPASRDFPAPRQQKSGPPTIGTAEFAQSDGRVSRAGTTGTGLGTISITEGNSIFSLPNRSSQSLATTLTTIQSSVTPNLFAQDGTPGGTGRLTYQLPRPLNPQTYSSMTANNMLTDNASVLTLASSRRHRRNSLDTNASVRAIPPASLFNTSRESLLQFPPNGHHSDVSAHGMGSSQALIPSQYPSLRIPAQADAAASLRSIPLAGQAG